MAQGPLIRKKFFEVWWLMFLMDGTNENESILKWDL
jgi:hypothetical protein